MFTMKPVSLELCQLRIVTQWFVFQKQLKCRKISFYKCHYLFHSHENENGVINQIEYSRLWIFVTLNGVCSSRNEIFVWNCGK